MKTNFKRMASLAALMMVLVTASISLQGCGETEDGFLMGAQNAEPELIAGATPEAGIDNVPDIPCRTNGTGDILFRNISRETGYNLMIQGRYRGTVKAASELRITVEEGLIEWSADPTNPKGAAALTGTLEMKRCERRVVRIPFDARTTPYEEAND